MKIIKTPAAIFVSLALFFGVAASAAEERTVQLEGVKNTRDLGGLKTTDGRTVRKGQLIRSGEVDHISEESMRFLEDAGVSAIVDLRTTKEATGNPVNWPEGKGPARFNFPLMERESQLIDDMRASIATGTAKAEQIDGLFRDSFTYIATDYTTELRALFDVLLNQPDGEAVLYHCSGGKDRTGVATVLVLSALGVERAEIVDDFMMSNSLVDADNAAVELAAKINKEQGTSLTAADVWPSLGVRASYLIGFVDSVSDSYGSIDGYLREGLGLTDSDFVKLQQRYLE